MSGYVRRGSRLFDPNTGAYVGEIDSNGQEQLCTSAAFVQPEASGKTLASSYTGGTAPWTRLFGPNELRQAPWAGSAELTGALTYTTAASSANGPCMFRREGASMRVDGSVVLTNSGNPTFGNINTSTAGIAAGALQHTTIAILVYAHRLGGNAHFKLRIGLNSSNYLTYDWAQTANMLVEGWNVLLVHTDEPQGAGNAPFGQQAFQSGFSVLNGFLIGTGTFDFSQAIGYVALEMTGLTAQTTFWVEGMYTGGKDKPQLTIGFDIQTSGLDLAKSTMDKYGLVGYADTPTGNGNPSNPQYLWAGADVARLQSLYTCGWEILQHSVSHNSFGTFADEGMLQAELEVCREQLITIGCPSGADLFCTPNGSWSNRLVALGARLGLKWMRHVNNAPMLISRGLVGMGNPMIQGAQSMANQTDAVRTLAFFDLLIQYGVSGHIFTHAIQTAASDSLNTNVTVFDAICAGLATRIAAGSIENVVPSKFLRQSTPPNMAAVLSLPSRLVLTPGASPWSLINPGYRSMRIAVSGGTVSAIAYSRDGSTFDATGLTAGVFEIAPGDQIRITYSVTPTVIQFGL